MTTSNKKDFQNWVTKNNIHVASSSELTSLKIGDIVTFTNNYGVSFSGLEVLGFCDPESWGGCVYLDKESFWHPVNPKNLKK
ncbi:MAG: hypothetical protein LUE98_04620 [Tannerellaceae bacterium]|nr:hypothetical protein [Tannerellaceae bacterium]